MGITYDSRNGYRPNFDHVVGAHPMNHVTNQDKEVEDTFNMCFRLETVSLSGSFREIKEELEYFEDMYMDDYIELEIEYDYDYRDNETKYYIIGVRAESPQEKKTRIANYYQALEATKKERAQKIAAKDRAKYELYMRLKEEFDGE